MKIDYDISVETGQTFVVERFKPEDARGVAHLFLLNIRLSLSL